MTENNTFRSKSNTREKRNDYNSSNKNRYKIEKQLPPSKPNRQSIVKELDNAKMFPSLDNKTIVPEKIVSDDTDKPKVSEYLNKCMQVKEEYNNKITLLGWTEFRYDKQTNKTSITKNGNKYTMEEYREKCIQTNIKEEEEECEIRNQEAISRLYERHENQLFDDYEMYGDDSIMWQEHRRFLKYLEEYPEDEEDTIDAENEDYDSYSD